MIPFLDISALDISAIQMLCRDKEVALELGLGSGSGFVLGLELGLGLGLMLGLGLDMLLEPLMTTEIEPGREGFYPIGLGLGLG